MSLFLAVWILYAGDRLLDARPQSGAAREGDPGARGDLLERHYFHRRYKVPFLAGILVCLVTLLVMLLYADKGVLTLYAAPGTLLAAWLLLVHAGRARRQGRRPLPKELAVGLFFPLAVFLPTFAQAPALGWELLPFLLLFAAVCSLNCLFLYAWEHGSTLEAHSTTRWSVRHLSILAHGTVAISLLVSIVMALPLPGMPRSSESLARCGLACAPAVLFLLLLHRHHRRFEPLTLRVAADAALLTPLLFIHLHG